MATQDLRSWIAKMEAAGEIRHISGAGREEEIGGIVDFYQRKTGNPAVLFDDIPGYSRGHRVMANILTSIRRIHLTLGQSGRCQRPRPRPLLAPLYEAGESDCAGYGALGALLENVSEGRDIDLFRIPVPKWHELDGGYYIGTGDMVVMKHRDTGWVNYGAYRVQAHQANVASVMCSKGKHGDIIMRSYHDKGEPCPVAVVCGMHPMLFMIAGLEIPYGSNEYDAAGGLLGEPVEVIAGPRTGLPIPAHAEIAFEGFIHPGDLIEEGPLGRMDRLLCRRAQERAGHSPRDLHAPQRSHPDGRDSRACRRMTIHFTAAPIVRARCGISWKQPVFPKSKAYGRMKRAAAGCG